MQNQTIDQSSFVTQKELESRVNRAQRHLEVLIQRSINESLNKKRQPKSTFISWCERSDVNGLSKIFEYENVFIRFVLFIILLVYLGFTAWFMSWSILDYFERDIVSKIQVVYEKPTEFPAVTFCDSQPFTTQKSVEFVNNFQKSPDCKANNCSKHHASLKVFESFYTEEKRKQLGLKLNQISCSFNNSPCTANLNWLWNFDYGSCFQFNVDVKRDIRNDPITMSNVAGRDYGLLLTIKNFTSPNISKVGVYTGSGLIVYVHNRTLLPRWYEEGVFVKPGEISMVGVKRTFVRNEPSPYTECTDLKSYSSILYDFIIKSNRTYRQKDCFDLCIQLETINKCGCYYVGDPNPSPNQIKPCLNLSEYDCYVHVYFKFNPVDCALVYCPLECNSIEYNLSISSKILPTLNEYNSLNISSSISYEEWRTQTVTFHVFYSQLEYTLIEETPEMTITSLIANLGGTMGLIVSVSFFTIVELVELFILVVYSFVNNIKQRISKNSVSSISHLTKN